MNSNNSPDLSVTLAGVRMRTPIAVGSVGTVLINPAHLTPELHAEVLLKHVEAGAGHIVLPTITYAPQELLADLEKRARPYDYGKDMPSPKFMKIETKGYGLEGLYFALSTGITPKILPMGLQMTQKLADVVRQKKPDDVPIIGSVAPLGAFPETIVACAKALEEAGVDLIEVNIACGLGASLDEAVESHFDRAFPLCYVGSLVADEPDLAAGVVAAAAQAVNIPVGVKLSTETGFPRIVDIARRVRDAGARFVNCGNMAVTIAPPDIYRAGQSTWPFMDGNPFVGGCGNWLRMIVYKQVAGIAKFVPGLDVIATGGLVTPEHTVEAMMLGAKVTQGVTGLLYNGRRLLKKNIQFLNRYMEEQGYQSVNDFIGLGLEHIKPINRTDFMSGKAFAEVDPLKCNGCGRCTDHICLASHMENGIARVEVEECLGCGMCVALCPEGAVTLREKGV